MDCHRVGLIGFTLVLATAALLHSTTAETYTVLGSGGPGWDIPAAGNDAVYRTWSAAQDFHVGDALLFNFATNTHDVNKVTKANYDSCTSASPISTISTGPATVDLTTAGMHYFICSFGTHCKSGQKLAVNVTADDTNTRTPPAATPPPSTRTPAATPPRTSTTPTTPSPPSTTTTPTTNSPPAPSSASSITFGGFSVAILSIALVFLH